MTRFTCSTPATAPGAPAANTTCAGCAPTVAETGWMSGMGSCEGLETLFTLPVTAVGVVLPSPVMNTCTMVPLAAGWLGPFTELSWLRIAPGPEPEAFCVKIAGDVAAACSETPLEVWPRYLTTR